MLKGRITRVVFASGIAPSESEYFDEIKAFDKKGLWFLLLFISRTIIPIANGVQMTYYTILNDVEGTCYIPEIAENGWSYTEIVKITRYHRTDFKNPIERCEYIDYNYTELRNRTFREAIQYKKRIGMRQVKDCKGGKILLSRHSSKYFTQDMNFCNAKDVVKKMIVWKNTGYVFGALIITILGDLFGRRLISIIVAVLWSICSLSSALIPETDMGIFLFFYTANCCFFIGCELLSFINLIEICPKKIRFFVVFTVYGYIFGFIVCTRFADHLLFERSSLQFISFSFTLCALFHCWYTPESPRWLINKSKYLRSLEVIKEIIGYIPNELLFEDEGSETPFTWRTVPEMFSHLWRRKLRILTIISMIFVIVGFIRETQVWRLMVTKYPLKISIVAASADLLSLPYTLIMYAALGKKYGLIWAILILSFISFLILCIEESVGMEYSTSAIIIMNAVTAQAFIFAYIPDLLPTFLRCTGLGMTLSLSALARIITVQAISWEKFGNTKIYIMFLVLLLPGFFIFKLPDTTHADLPTVRLFRS